MYSTEEALVLRMDYPESQKDRDVNPFTKIITTQLGTLVKRYWKRRIYIATTSLVLCKLHFHFIDRFFSASVTARRRNGFVLSIDIAKAARSAGRKPVTGPLVGSPTPV